VAASSTAVEANPFEQVTRRRVRPGFTLEPIAIAWNAVAFRLSGARDGVACVPREELAAFFDDLDAGLLDERVREFLLAPPTGRVLRSADQTRSGGLFDSITSSDAIVPAERVPGRALGLGRGGGGTPADARRRKRQRPRSPRRVLVGAAVATVVVVATVATVVAATSGGSNDKTVAVNAPVTTLSSTTLPTTTSKPLELAMASLLQGSWTVTRTVTSSNNPRQPVGQVLQLAYVITSSCVTTPCTVHVDAEGSQGAREQIDLTFGGDQYKGLVSGTAPCNSFTTGAHLGDTTLTGSMAVSATRSGQFSGTLILNVVPNAQCVGTTIMYSLTASK